MRVTGSTERVSSGGVGRATANNPAIKGLKNEPKFEILTYLSATDVLVI
jgi:hypothetical protein